MVDTVLGEAVSLLQDFGFFEIILPFLLVFTIVFGVLEKTKIFGTEDGKPKKNINAMIAFSIAFFVVASKEVVASLQESLPLVALFLIAVVSLLMLVGTLASGKEEFDFYALFDNDWNKLFGGAFIVAIVLIFFHSFGWLTWFYDFVSALDREIIIIAVFLVITAGIMKFIFDAGKDGTSSTNGGEP